MRWRVCPAYSHSTALPPTHPIAMTTTTTNPAERKGEESVVSSCTVHVCFWCALSPLLYAHTQEKSICLPERVLVSRCVALPLSLSCRCAVVPLCLCCLLHGLAPVSLFVHFSLSLPPPLSIVEASAEKLVIGVAGQSQRAAMAWQPHHRPLPPTLSLSAFAEMKSEAMEMSKEKM